MFRSMIAACALAGACVLAGYGLTSWQDLGEHRAPVYEVSDAIAVFNDCGDLYMLTLVFEDGSVKWYGGETRVVGGLTVEEAMDIAQRLPREHRYATVFPCKVQTDGV